MMNDQINIAPNLRGASPGAASDQLAPTANQENVDPATGRTTNNVQSNGPSMMTSNNNNVQVSKPPKSSRPRSSAATSVTSGTTLGTTTVQSGRGQHKLKSRFSVIRKLGKGTYGKVQLAINKETGQEVAIKTIKKSKIENEQDLERVRREIQIMSSIEHPHIVHIYEVFENKDKIVLVMQYAPGGELYEYVSQSKLLDDNEARRLFRQIATAIYYCHQNKICHRDLKLENILLDEKNNAKLADFGLSNVFDKRRQLSTFCGSPLYASPEIVQGSPYEGPEVDCWSLGVLLYTLVYGAMPFDGSNFKRLVKQISDASYFEPKQKSQASPLIKHLLCADPKRRATIIDICRDPWVNGTIPVVVGSGSMQTKDNPNVVSPPANRHSLLQVAQDMVKLAPVRLDILMALLPPELAQPASSHSPEFRSREKELIAPNDNNDVNAASEQKNNDNFEIASYVIRDLDSTETSPPRVDHEQHQQQESMEVDEISNQIVATNDQKMDVVAQQQNEDQVVPDQVGELLDNDKIETKVEDQESSMPIELDHEQSSLPMEVDKIDEMQTSATTMEQETVLVASGDEPQELNLVENNENVKVGDVEPMPEDSNNQEQPDAISDQQQQNELSSRIESNDMDRDRSEPEQLISSDHQPSEQVASDNCEKVDASDKDKLSIPASGMSDESSRSPTSDSGPAKPKKKKKIIVVKKVVKKGKAGAGKETKDEPKEEQQVNSDSVPDDKTPTANQATDDTGQPKRKQSNPTGASMRRRSTLVAEMSDKLLQQLSADLANGASSPNAALKMEQAALFGQVNVSEKKEDFERRASLLLTEPEIEHCRRPSFDRLTSVKVDEAPESNEGPLDKSDSLDTLVAPLTADEQQPDSAKLPSPTCVSCEWDDLSSIKSSHVEINLSSPIENANRETVKLEEPILKPTRTIANQQENPELISERASSTGGPAGGAGSASLGPVPITRSYKKVTFTKDGACVTETGKVYSAKGDDGTMRRIERKSKVTHYPADQAEFYTGLGNKKKVVTKQMEETTSEVFSSGWPLERLVMPSSSLIGGANDAGDDLEDDEFFLNTPEQTSSFQANQSTARRQPKMPNDPFDLSFSSRPGVAHSESNASSCSSASTDVFDDIFDNWTGAISMFERQNYRLRDSFERKFGLQSPSSLFGKQRAFMGHHHSSSRNQRRKISSSGSASGRCESADHQQRPPSDSDGHGQQSSRPASTIGGSIDQADQYQHQRVRSGNRTGLGLLRHGFGGSRPNVFFESNQADPMVEKLFDTSETEELMRQISIKHSQLRRQLSGSLQKHWRGSTPSLFEPDTIESTSHEPMTLRRISPLPPSANNTTRIPPSSAGPPRPPLPSRTSTAPKIPDETAFPLNSKPIRVQMGSSDKLASDSFTDHHDRDSEVGQKTVEFLQKATSRSSIISDRLSQVHLSQHSLSSKRRQVANFIELKRTSSSSLAMQQSNEPGGEDKLIAGSILESVVSKTARESQQAPIKSRRPFVVDDNLELFAPNEKIQSTCIPGGQHQETHRPEATDMRIQSWLQESSSNFSSSSGSKSSTSFATMDGHQPVRTDSSFGNLYHQQPTTRISAMSSAKLVHTIPTQQEASPVQNPHHHSTSSTTLSCTSKKLIDMEPLANVTSPCGTPIENRQKQVSKTISTASVNKASSSTTTTTMTTTNYSTTLQMSGNSVSIPGHPSSLTKASTSAAATTMTTKTTSSSMIDDFFGNDDPFGDHQSQSTNSSRSILDQLRTRGLKSVLSQRLASTATTCGGGAPTDSGFAITEQAASSPISSQSSTGLQETASSSIISSRQQQHQHQHQSTDDGINWKHQAFEESEQIESGESKQATHQDDNNNATTNNIETIEKPKYDSNEQQGEEEEEQEDDDDDDCLKTARANIKTYRDRMKETDLFLKTLAVADEQAQRQRQELFLFNDLMIRNKLNGLNRYMTPYGGDFVDESPYSQSKTAGYRSAPIHSSWLSGKETNPLLGMLNGNGFGLDSMTNYKQQQQQQFATAKTSPVSRQFEDHEIEPSFCRPTRIEQHEQADFGFHMHNDRSPVRGSEKLQMQARVPMPRAQSLAPDFDSRYQANLITGASDLSPFSKSAFQPIGSTDLAPSPQLSHRRTRPLSINLSDTVASSADDYNSPSLINLRNRRSQSVARQPTNYDSSPPQTTKNASIYMTEYQRAFGQDKAATSYRSNSIAGLEKNPFTRQRTFGLASSRDELAKRERYQVNGREDAEGEDDDDDDPIEKSMREYRPSSYVPKIVPQGLPARHASRSYKRRSLTYDLKTTPYETSRLDRDNDSPLRSTFKPSFGTEKFGKTEPNLSDNDDDEDKKVTGPARRASMFSGPADLKADSRLSELESRLEANKRRREELLAASKREGAAIPSVADQYRSKRGLVKSGDDQPAERVEPTVRARSVTRELSPASFGNQDQAASKGESGASKSSARLILPRSSRLESMEARIKRRSYCVRVVDESTSNTNNDIFSRSSDIDFGTRRDDN